MPSVGKQVEEPEIAHTANVNWYNYFGEQFDITVTAETRRQLNNLSVLQ